MTSCLCCRQQLNILSAVREFTGPFTFPLLVILAKVGEAVVFKSWVIVEAIVRVDPLNDNKLFVPLAFEFDIIVFCNSPIFEELTIDELTPESVILANVGEAVVFKSWVIVEAIVRVDPLIVN